MARDIYDWYIAPEEYSRAAENGVTKKRLEERIRSWNWSKEKAILTPPRPLSDHSKWHVTAQENGISRETFYSRVLGRKWDPERAATQPLQSDEERKQSTQVASEAARVHPLEYVELARQNGIPYKRFHWRISHGWSYERAATEQAMPPEERGRQGKQAVLDRYGNINAPIFQRKSGAR